MKTKTMHHFWIPFAINIFITSSITMIIVSLGFTISSKLNTFNNKFINDFYAIIIFLSINIALASVFTLIITALANKSLKPIKSLIEAINKVSKGDFSIKLEEQIHPPVIKELNTSFNKMVNELNSIETLRNDFIVNVSHEFKTPIAAIEGYATLLQDNDLTEEERNEYTKIILDSASQLSSLSGNILKLSKLETQEIVPDKKYFSLDEQLRQALLLLENQWSKKI